MPLANEACVQEISSYQSAAVFIQIRPVTLPQNKHTFMPLWGLWVYFAFNTLKILQDPPNPSGTPGFKFLNPV